MDGVKGCVAMAIRIFLCLFFSPFLLKKIQKNACLATGSDINFVLFSSFPIPFDSTPLNGRFNYDPASVCRIP
jgi:hypothetical protein